MLAFIEKINTGFFNADECIEFQHVINNALRIIETVRCSFLQTPAGLWREKN